MTTSSVCPFIQLTTNVIARFAFERIDCSGVYKLHSGKYRLVDDDGYTRDHNIERPVYSRVAEDELATKMFLYWDEPYKAWQVAAKMHTQPFLLSAASEAFTPFSVPHNNWEVHRNGKLQSVQTAGGIGHTGHIAVRCINAAEAVSTLKGRTEDRKRVRAGPTLLPTLSPTDEPTLYPTAFPSPVATSVLAQVAAAGVGGTSLGTSSSTAPTGSSGANSGGNARSGREDRDDGRMSDATVGTVWLVLAFLVQMCSFLCTECCRMLQSSGRARKERERERHHGIERGGGAGKGAAVGTAEETAPMVVSGSDSDRAGGGHGGGGARGTYRNSGYSDGGGRAMLEAGAAGGGSGSGRGGSFVLEDGDPEEEHAAEIVAHRAREKAEKIFDQIMV
jgi:hypothetical protein